MLKKNGREYVWQNDNGLWNSHAPLLFPHCGRCILKINGVEYPPSFHGFLRGKETAVFENSKDFISFITTDDSDTKKVYPFDFEFKITYRLIGDSVFIDYNYTNLSTIPACFASGGHDSFNLDDEIENYRLIFSDKEIFVQNEHDNIGFLTGNTIPLGEGKVLPLPKNILSNNNTLIFNDVNSNNVTLEHVSGKKICSITFNGFKNLLLWRPLDSKMICIEPWQNLPDLQGQKVVEFKDKKGVVSVPPKKSITFTREIKYY